MVALERGATLVMVDDKRLYGIIEEDIAEKALEDVAAAMGFLVDDYLTYLDSEGRGILARLSC